MSEDFVVHDKRLFTKDGQVNPETADESQADNRPAEEKAPPTQGRPDPALDSGPLPPANFAGLMIGLATSAFIHLGESPEGAGEPAAKLDLPEAKYAIDILAVLQTKTKGNLTDEEDALLTTLLYDLRLKYVQASSGK